MRSETGRQYFSASASCGAGTTNLVVTKAGFKPIVTKLSVTITNAGAAVTVDVRGSSSGAILFDCLATNLAQYGIPDLFYGLQGLTTGDGIDCIISGAANARVVLEGYYEKVTS